jgi:para-aminobenzoate synthetase/4-amino-4-deoxychorismate lyase
LAGTLRAELIDRGELFERTITKEELAKAESFALINSVRGWMPAQLVTNLARLESAGGLL